MTRACYSIRKARKDRGILNWNTEDGYTKQAREFATIGLMIGLLLAGAICIFLSTFDHILGLPWQNIVATVIIAIVGGAITGLAQRVILNQKDARFIFIAQVCLYVTTIASGMFAWNITMGGEFSPFYQIIHGLYLFNGVYIFIRIHRIVRSY